MRIGRVNPVTVGAGYPGTRLTAPPSGAAIVAGGLVSLAATAGEIGEQQRRQEAEEARRLGEIEASELLGQIEIATVRHKATLTTVTDADEYMKTLREGADAIALESLGRAKSPYARDLLKKKIPGLLAATETQALTHAQGLRTSGTKAQVTNVITNAGDLIDAGPVEDGRAFARHLASALVAIEAATPWLGADEAAKIRDRTRADLHAKRIRRYVASNPVGFLAAVERGEFSGFDAAMIAEKKNDAAARIVAQNNLEADQAAKRERYFADLLDKDTQALVGDFEARVRTVTGESDRAGIVRDLNLRRELRQIKPADYARLYDAAMKQDDVPSHPDVLSRVGMDVESIRPTTTFAEIDRLHDAHRRGQAGLSFKDATRIKSKLRETTEALNNTAKADFRRDHEQVEQELRGVLGIKPGMIQQIMGDDPQARLWGEGLAELRRRSNVYSGKEAPLAVWRDMRERYVKASGQNAQLKAAELAPLLYAPTRAALEAAKPRISRELYLLELGKFDRLDALGWRPATTGSPQPTGEAPFKVGPRGGDKK